MTRSSSDFVRVAIDPLNCLSAGWESIKDQYWIFFAITLVGVLLAGIVPLGILAGPMYCGIFYAWFRLERGESLTFEMLFKGFDYFVESLVATLILVGVGIVIFVPTYLAMMAAVFLGVAGAENSQDPSIAGLIVVIAIVFIGMVVFALSVVIGMMSLYI